jgi:hypothetical protein
MRRWKKSQRSAIEMSGRCLPLLVLLVHGGNAQTCLSVSTAAIAPGGTADLEISLTSPPQAPLAALQWTFDYPSAAIRSLTVADGAAAKAAGKTVMCSGSTTANTCLVAGANANTIGNGVVAKLSVTLAPDVTIAVIAIRDSLGASPAGYFVAVGAQSGLVTSANVSPGRGLHPPLRRVRGGQCPSAP